MQELRPDQVAELVAAYQAGDSTYVPARRYGGKRETASKHLQQAGVARRGEALGAPSLSDPAAIRERADVVIDPVGGDTTARSWPVMRSGATLVAIAEEPVKGERGRDDVRAVYFVVKPDGGQLLELAALIDKQQLHPMVSMVFGLTALPQAFRALRAARAPGKVVVSIDGTTGHQAMQHPASLP